MTLFFRLVIVVALHVLVLPAVWANCQESSEYKLTGEAFHHNVKLDGNISSHPLGKTVKIIVPTSLVEKDGAELSACIRWKPDNSANTQNPWLGGLVLHTIESKDGLATVSVELPKHIDAANGIDPTANFWDRPTAELRLQVQEGESVTFDTLLPIKITSRWFSMSIAVVFSIIFWSLCFYIAYARGISGEGFKGFILKVIVNKYGYASLSQFQIMLWTMVVGSSVVYVMVLTGQLINIQGSMLTLLGVAGLSSVISSIKKTGSTESDEQPETHPPAGVVGLQVCGKPSKTQLVLAWQPPMTGGEVDYYEVQYAISGTTDWQTVISSITEAPVTVTLPELAAEQTYDVQVYAVNRAGKIGRTIERITMASTDGETPAAISNLVVSHVTQHSIRLSWEYNTNAKPDSYVLRYRDIDTGLWIVAGVINGMETTFELLRLCQNTEYCIDVSAVTAGNKSESTTIVGKTSLRQPRFSDLLMASDAKEIDVSRIQMLFFTVISAVFVLLKVFSANEIPEIPEGILTLMGISNGVYLSAKFMNN